MWTHGMNAAARRRRAAVLAAPHWRRVRVHLLTLEGRRVADLSGHLVDGQVDFDAHRLDSIRSATVTLWDPGARLGLDSADPGVALPMPTRMMRIFDDVRAWDDPPGEWIETPVFTGPVVKPARDGARLTVECAGKEMLMAHAVNGGKTWPKGTSARDVLTSLILLGGEHRTEYSIPASRARLPRNLTIGPFTDLWRTAKNLAYYEMGMDLYYTGWGSLLARAWQTKPVHTFRPGEGGGMTVDPQASLDVWEDFHNRWVVELPGKGDKDQAPYGYAVIPKGDPRSPWALGRHGVPIAYDDISQSQTSQTLAQARVEARELMAAAESTNLHVEWDGPHQPHLEPYDLVRVETDTWGREQRLLKSSLPLVSGVQHFGGTRAVSRRGRTR